LLKANFITGGLYGRGQISLLGLMAFPVSAQRSLSTPASRIDVTRRNYAAVPEDPEAIYEGARVVHNGERKEGYASSRQI
jgi:hypothetical protein